MLNVYLPLNLLFYHKYHFERWTKTTNPKSRTRRKSSLTKISLSFPILKFILPLAKSRTRPNPLLPNSLLEHRLAMPNPISSFPNKWPLLIVMENKHPKDPTTFLLISSATIRILHGKWVLKKETLLTPNLSINTTLEKTLM